MPFEKAHTGAEEYQRGQDKLEIPAVLHPDGFHYKHMHRRNEVRSHLKNEYWKCENGCQNNILFQLNRFRVALVGLCFLLNVAACLIKRTRFIARFFNRLYQISDCDLSCKLNMRALSCEVDAGARNARNRA